MSPRPDYVIVDSQRLRLDHAPREDELPPDPVSELRGRLDEQYAVSGSRHRNGETRPRYSRPGYYQVVSVHVLVFITVMYSSHS